VALSLGGSADGQSRRLNQLLTLGLVSLGFQQEAEEQAQARLAEGHRVLRSAVEALHPLARRTPGFDMTLALGHEGPAVRLRYTTGGLMAERLTRRGRAATREPAGPVVDESLVVSELASMLWSGEVQTP
jgi:hypothetical protein